VFKGDGLYNTFIKQGSTGNPAWWCVSRFDIYQEQILGAELTDVWFLGKTGATVAACKVEGLNPFVVAYSKFHIGGSGCYHTLEVKTGTSASFTGSVAAGTGILTVSSVASGVVELGAALTNNGTFTNVYITAQLSGTTGGAGTYQTNTTSATAVNGTLPPAFEVYSSSFRVTQQDQMNLYGGVGSYNTGVKCGAGVYNEWYLNIAGSANGVAWEDSGWSSHWYHPISEGQQNWYGQANVIICPTIEAWAGSAAPGGAAMQILGGNNKVIAAQITSVPAAKASIGIALNNGGGNNTTILGYKIFGAAPDKAPTYPMQINAGCSGTIADALTGGCTYRLDQYTSDDILKNFTFVGDCDELVSAYLTGNPTLATFTPTLTFGGGSTGISYTVRHATWQRVGSICYFNININLGSKGTSTGAAKIEGLPFYGKSGLALQQPVSIYFENVNGTIGQFNAFIGSGQNWVTLKYVPADNMRSDEFNNNTNLRLSGFYFL
jgi:hypothetical protein